MDLQEQMDISLIDMIMSLSDAMDLVNVELNGHHQRVSYIASCLAKQLGSSESKKKDLMMAGALHDVGAFSLKERLNILNFEFDISHEWGLSKHAVLGYKLVGDFKPFVEMAPLILYHHLNWEQGAGALFRGQEVPLEAHILHLADRIDVLINKDESILEQKDRIKKLIVKERGNKFIPRAVEAFVDLAQNDSFWLDTISVPETQVIAKEFGRDKVSLDLNGLYDLGKIFSQIIDFRSRFTASHSSGVAASAEALANFIGLSEEQALKLRVAGYLHDLGKLTVPTEILEKKGKLTEAEYEIIKEHAFYTYHSLASIEGLNEINEWASFHHECPNGQGYPFQYGGQKLSVESRIIAVADVFTALAEDRPYREGMKAQQALSILGDMAAEGSLDGDLILTLQDNYKELDCLREWAQRHEMKEYWEFQKYSLSS